MEQPHFRGGTESYQTSSQNSPLVPQRLRAWKLGRAPSRARSTTSSSSNRTTTTIAGPIESQAFELESSSGCCSGVAEHSFVCSMRSYQTNLLRYRHHHRLHQLSNKPHPEHAWHCVLRVVAPLLRNCLSLNIDCHSHIRRPTILPVADKPMERYRNHAGKASRFSRLKNLV